MDGYLPFNVMDWGLNMTLRGGSVAVVTDSRRLSASRAAVSVLSGAGYRVHQWVVPSGTPGRAFAPGIAHHQCNLLVTLTGPRAAAEIVRQVAGAVARDERPYDIAGWVHAGPADGGRPELQAAASTLAAASVGPSRPDLWLRIAAIPPGKTRADTDYWAPVLEALRLFESLRRDIARHKEQQAAVARVTGQRQPSAVRGRGRGATSPGGRQEEER